MTWALVTRGRGMGGWTHHDFLVEWTGADYHGRDDVIGAVCTTREAARAALRLLDTGPPASERDGTGP